MIEPRPQFVPEHYTPIELLGSGQTSFVYLATHPQFGEVALKLPRPELQHRPILWRMFENEVQITLSLNGGKWRSSNVITALEGYPTSDKAFLVLEYCAGGTLDELLLKEKLLPLEDACRLILEVARGLEFTHKQQVLHRDVKPANILLTSQAQARLADFGTGMFMTEQTKERVGTAFYMAPEIFEGNGPSIQSDVYSLGVLAYEVLAGARPFDGNSYDELMLQHLTSVPVNLRYKRKDVSTEISQVIAKAMSRDQVKRFATVREFINAFEAETVNSQDLPQEVGRFAQTRAKVVSSALRSEESNKASKDDPPNKGFFGWFKRKG